jgi:aspartate aminotransferase
VAKAAENIQSQFTSATCSITQKAAVAALNGPRDSADDMLAEFTKRRAFVFEQMSQMPGLKLINPDGAFYMFPDVSSFFGKSYDGTTISNADDLCMYLLHKANVTFVTGSAFQQPNALRISYAASMEKLQEGMKRLKAALEKLA